MLVDVHSHLDQFVDNIDEIILRAKNKGIEKIITVGTDYKSSVAAVHISNCYNGIYSSVGFHPDKAGKITARDVEKIIPFLQNEKVVAIGETGLDYYRNSVPLKNQKSLFLSHICLSLDSNKPIIIHCREAHRDCQELLEKEMPKPIKGIMHCFSGTKDDAREYLDMGLYISFSGIVTFSNAGNLRDVVKYIPLDRILLETDSPYLAPQSHRGKRNEPSYVIYVAQEISNILNISFDNVSNKTTQNVMRLFKEQNFI